jgi:hypothetical protein
MADKKEKTLSNKERYMQRVKQNNPDLDMDNEEAFYEDANNRYDDYESLKEGMNTIRSSMADDPYFADMLASVRKNKQFDPAMYLLESDIDIEALLNDENKREKFAEIRAKWLENHRNAEQLENKIAENLPKSIEECKAKGAEIGLSEEETEKVIDRYFGLLDDIEEGVLPVDIFVLLAKGGSYDEDVVTARKQGEANGRAERVRERIKQTPKSAPRNGGVQESAIAEKVPNDENNMFGL